LATLHDVARAAGVSATTVSYVINNRTGHFSDDTRIQVLKAMKSVGYIPNSVARSLVLNKTETFGILLSSVLDEPFNRALRAGQSVLNKAGYDVIVTETQSSVDREQHALANMLSRRVDGILFISGSRQMDHSHITEFVKSGTPLVMVNRYLPEGVTDQVIIDNYIGVKQIVAHLIAQGHKRIGCLHNKTTGPTATVAVKQRVQGYLDGMRAADLPVDEKWMMVCNYTTDYGVQAGSEAARRLLTEERLTALVCVNDFIAVGVYRTAIELGMRVPEDVAITGHDNTILTRYHTPEITSIAQPISEASTLAAKRLLTLVGNGSSINPGQWTQVLPTEPVIRTSSLYNRA
jgi:LacI family transcriptional regulator